MYFDEVIRLHEKGYGKVKISHILPLSPVTIMKWIHIFVVENKGNIVQMKKNKSKSHKVTIASSPQVVEDSRSEINRLRLALKNETQRANRESLRSDAYNELINVAESKFSIKIRKKN